MAPINTCHCVELHFGQRWSLDVTNVIENVHWWPAPISVGMLNLECWKHVVTGERGVIVVEEFNVMGIFFCKGDKFGFLEKGTSCTHKIFIYQ